MKQINEVRNRFEYFNILIQNSRYTHTECSERKNVTLGGDCRANNKKKCHIKIGPQILCSRVTDK